jgi:tetratricopeptide (TPR) repeat protein
MLVLECESLEEKPVRAFARFATLPVLIVFMMASSSAQRTTGPSGIRHEIVGKITNESDHSPMQNVAVRLITASGETISTTYSGPNGEFNFEDLAGADYVLVIKVDGFEPVKQDARLTSIPTLTANIALHKSAGEKADADTSGESVSTRELSLPPKAKDALAKGRERLYEKHDPAGSLPFFQKVLQISPGFYEAYYQEGVAFTLSGKSSDAEAAFSKAIEASEHHYAEPCFALASLLTDTKQFSKAEEVDREGLQTDPEAWRGYYELARAQLGEGHPADAEKSGIEAQKRKADFAGLYLILANIHLQLHNNQAVLEDVNTFLKLEPDGPASDQARAIKSQMERALGRTPGQSDR